MTELESKTANEYDGDSEQPPKKAIISLGELVDLALCTPEPGAVNFNLLRSLLHALVNRLDLVDIKAEILDEDTDNAFAQILENAEKLGLDMRPRSGEHHSHEEEQHRRRQSLRASSIGSRAGDAGSSRRSTGAGSRAGAVRSRPGTAGSGRRSGADAPVTDDTCECIRRCIESGGSHATDGGGGSGSRASGGRSGSGGGSGSARARAKSGDGSEHGEEFDQMEDEFCPPDSAGQPDVGGKHRTSSSTSLVFSSGSDTSQRGAAAGRRSTLSELAEHRLRKSGRQSAVSIGSGADASAVFSDYTSLDRLAKKMNTLEEKLDIVELAEMLPKVRELQAAINSSQEDVTGLWQNLQLLKKVDTNEEGIDRLSGVIEDLLGKLKKVKKQTDKLDNAMTNILGVPAGSLSSSTSIGSAGRANQEGPVNLPAMERKYDQIKKVLENTLGISLDDGVAEPGALGPAADGAGVAWNALEEALKGDLMEMGDLNDEAMKSISEQQLDGGADVDKFAKVKRLLCNLGKLVKKHKALEARVALMEEALGDSFSDQVLEQLQLLKASASQIQQLKDRITAAGAEGEDLSGFGSGTGSLGGRASGDRFTIAGVELPSMREPSAMDLNHLSDWLNYNKARMEQLEKALVSQSEQVRDFGDRLGDQVITFRDKLERVERELAGMLGRLSASSKKTGMSREDSAHLHDAYSKLQSLQLDVESLANTSQKIVQDRGQIDDELAMLIRALEELKECKVDRATLDELIETKADRSSVEKKVSNWEFEQACQELSQALAIMLEKLSNQESDWVRSMDEIHTGLNKKLDRVEMAPLKRYINSRLKNIMMKLNRLIADDESPDATITRRKIIKNLHCLSCDDPTKITGLTATPTVPLLDPFPASVGTSHVTSLRMGAVRRRQQMKCEPYKDMSAHEGAFRSHIKREIDYMTYRGIPHHPTCPLYNGRVPYGRCTCVATRFCGGSHTKINCVDTRRRRVGLGAPLLPYGSPLVPNAVAKSPKRRSHEQLSKPTSETSQKGLRRGSGGGGAPAPTPAPGTRRSVSIRQTQSMGVSERKDSAAAPTGFTKSAPGLVDGPPALVEADIMHEMKLKQQALSMTAGVEVVQSALDGEPLVQTPTERATLSSVGAEPAAEGEASPQADGGVSPAGIEYPAEGDPASATLVDVKAPPAEIEMPPVDGDAPSTKSEVPLAESEGTPAEAGVTPADDGVTPVEGKVTPVEGGVTPAESGVTPAEGGVTPAEGGVTPAEGGVTPAEGGVTPAEGGVTPAEGGVTPADGGVTPAEGGVTPAEGGVTPAEGGVTPAEGGITPAEGGVTPTAGGVTPAEGLSTPAEYVAVPAEDNAASAGELSRSAVSAVSASAASAEVEAAASAEVEAAPGESEAGAGEAEAPPASPAEEKSAVAEGGLSAAEGGVSPVDAPTPTEVEASTSEAASAAAVAAAPAPEAEEEIEEPTAEEASVEVSSETA